MAAVISQGLVVFVHSQMFWLLKALCDCLELSVYLRHSDVSPVVLLARDVTKERESVVLVFPGFLHLCCFSLHQIKHLLFQNRVSLECRGCCTLPACIILLILTC